MISRMVTDELKQTVATRPDDLVVVVGAGVTIGALRGSSLAGLASWQGLLSSGLDYLRAIHAVKPADVDRIRGLLDSADPDLWIDAAQMITREFGGTRGGELRAWLRTSVGAFSGEVREREVLDSLKALSERGVLLATVNYDGLLEAATGLPPVTWRDASKVQRVIRREDRGVLHLHGYWEAPDSLVFGARSYDEVVADEHARTVLKALGMQRTFLFVGHGAGLQDPNWGSFLRWAEGVFAGLEHRHYRLVRDDERDRVQAEHPQGQRILAIPYGASHADLGPFLRSLLPVAMAGPTMAAADPVSTVSASTAAPADPGRTIVLRLNIADKNDKGFHQLTEKEAHDLADAPDVTCHSLERLIDRKAMTARQWRGLAQDVDALVKTARTDITVKPPVRLLIMGQAPLPVFAYLGHQMRRERGQVMLVNHRQGGDVWDRITRPEASRGAGEGPFTVTPPPLGRERRGTVVLSIQCSNEYPYEDDMVEPMLQAEGRSLLCSYKIHHKHGHRDVPMTRADLAILLRLVGEAHEWIKAHCRESDHLVVALGGPTWVAFWVADLLNANVRGRIDYPNRIPGRGYERALAAPMHEAPWFTGRAKLMIMGAEPDDQGSLRVGRAFDAIQEALARELGPNGPYEVRTRGATRVAEVMREIDRFKPDILHLHLHGSRLGDLAFEDERGETKKVSADAFIAMLKATGVQPALIVLSACHSAVLAPALAEIAECVVAMTDEMTFKVTITFSAGLYEALGRGKTMAKAIEQGKALAQAEHSTGFERIELLSAPEVDATEIILFRSRTG